MTFCLSAPSKTFLAGEYAVLWGAPALVLCTAPRFQLQVVEGTGRVSGIPTGAPAARWLEQRRPLLWNYDLNFVDPHAGRGGFGASGAQFLLCHALTTLLQGGFQQMVRGLDRRDLWQDLNVLSQGAGSGADVLAMSAGSVARVNVETQESHALTWPYPALGFAIVRTQEKALTHAHLAQLDRSRLKSFVPAAATVAELFGCASQDRFLEALRRWATGLRELILQTDSALNMIRLVEQQAWCLAAKGCGALGADTILFFYPVSETTSVQKFLQAQGWKCEAGVQDLTSGLRLEWVDNE